jgi:hypothetical protein
MDKWGKEMWNNLYEIWGFHNGEDVTVGLGCNAV